MKLRRVIIITIVFIVFLMGGLVFYFLQNNGKPVIEEIVDNYSQQNIIGTSVEGRKIKAYTYGNGKKHLLFVGGIHGGYEWNSILLAHEFINYFNANPKIIPEDLTITIIPSANPDGVYKVVGKEGDFSIADIPERNISFGRFNANKVDLNRNFDCKWKSKSTWKNKTVKTGSAPFSEPEAQVIRDFVLDNNPIAVIFWHSQAKAVYASECENGILPETLNIMNAYAKASGYSPISSFDSYKVTGDAEGWLASIGIPAITVELKNHQDIDWGENLAGVKALFEYYQ